MTILNTMQRAPFVNIGFHPNHESQSQDNQQNKTYLSKNQGTQILQYFSKMSSLPNIVLDELQCFSKILVPNAKQLKARVDENEKDLNLIENEGHGNEELSPQEVRVKASLQSQNVQASSEQIGTFHSN